ncbi:MAG: MaoC family dehydratase [Deltaproteobacteria bacterium]|nr:MaoC family dehydratase [Deltaproteobacteria bacterium]
MLYFEDIVVGDRRELGSHTFSRDEIVEFARAFDPQPFHLDEAAAARSHFRGLVASGWHTASVAMRLFVDGMAGQIATMGSPGVDELRWLGPVRPDDTVTLRTEILNATPSTSRSDRGSIRVRYELANQRGEVVLTMVGIGIIARRPSENRTT